MNMYTQTHTSTQRQQTHTQTQTHTDVHVCMLSRVHGRLESTRHTQVHRGNRNPHTNTNICVRSVTSDSFHPMDYSPPGSSVRGILQARILERVAISLNGESSRPRDGTCVSCISCLGGGDSLPLSHLGCPQNTHKKHTQVNRNVLGPNTLAKTRFRPQSIGQSKPYSHSQHQWGGNADFALRGTLRHITSGPPAWHLGVNTPILQS